MEQKSLLNVFLRFLSADSGKSGKSKKTKPATKKGVAQSGNRKKTVDSSNRSKKPVKPNRVVIDRRDAVPSFVSCLSNGGEHSFTGSYRERYIVLKKSNDSEQVYVLCSSDTGGIDKDFIYIREQFVALGYKIERLFASPSIIAILYESDDERKSELSASLEFDDARGIERDFDALIADAAENGVSDIHIEVRRKTAVIRERKDGDLLVKEQIAVSKARKMATVVYQVIADEKSPSFNESTPQNGVIDRLIDNVSIRLRLATIPAYPDGFDMVLRILTIGDSSKLLTFEEMGYDPFDIQQIVDAVSQPNKATILCGRTGSGKTTSLATMLDSKVKQYEGRIKIISIEDPPEKIINGVTHVPVLTDNKKVGENPFESAVRAALRTDADVINAGEVRDFSSAELLVLITQSGHQAFSTLHAPSAIGSVGRLRGLGISNNILGSNDFLNCLIYQTLVAKVCPHCSHTLDEVISFNSPRFNPVIARLRKTFDYDLSILNSIRFRNTKGCAHCNDGVKGRTVAAEVVIPDEYMLECFSMEKDNEARRHYYNECGGRTVMQHALDKLEIGMVCPLDLELVVGLIGREPRVFSHSKDPVIDESAQLGPDSSLESGEVVHDAPNQTDVSWVIGALNGAESVDSDNIVPLHDNNKNK